jgi:ankyrin repeat protein
VLRGDVALVKTLLGHGATPEIALARGTPVRRYSADFAFNAELAGATPFWLAARYGDVDVMRALADAGANTRFLMPDGTSALLAAVAASSGFSSGDRRERYMSPVQVAERNERENERITVETVKLLLTLGADVNHTNKAGDTAMHFAATQGLADVVELLAKAGANVEAKNGRDQTPLSIASARPRAVEGGVAPPSDERRLATVDMLKKLGAQR